MNYDRFIAIVRGNDMRLCRDGFLTHEDVYNIWYRMRIERTRKDRDPILSPINWPETIDAVGGFSFYDRSDRTSGVYFGFATKWQLQQLHTHGRTLCVDVTRDVFGQKTYLFTLVIKSRDVGLGVPVAFLLSKSTDSNILVAWLEGICTKLKQMFSSDGREYNYRPNAVMRLDLRAILYEKDISAAAELIAQFRVKWKRQKPMVAYLNKGYFGTDPLANDTDNDDDGNNDDDFGDDDDVEEDAESTAVEGLTVGEAFPQTTQGLAVDEFEAITRKRKHWMLCYRQDISYPCIDANNYIEAWHSSLEQHFIREKQQRRVDNVIYVLNDIVVPHFQQKCIRGPVNVGMINPTQKIETELVKRVKDHIAANGFVGMRQSSAHTIAIQSFTTPETEYFIQLDFSRSTTGHIISCTCPSFADSEMSCKHITLLQLEIPQLKFFKEDRHDIERDLDLMTPPPAIVDEPEQPPDISLAPDHRVYLDRINELESLRDKSKPQPHAAELCSLLSQFLRIYEPSMHRKENVELSNKRARQLY
ncbi:hypothetical protein DFQ26_002412 [Actinomortierella ambigua]|nr:hypothetical protein DFQ26_002412 [Actinomortierella ambigua]